jgi:HK97 gp10 family phage protein
MQEPSGIKVKGLKQAIKALQAIGVPDAEIKAAGTQSGEIVASQARSIVPVKTGALRSSIRVSKALRKVTISAGNNKGVPYANPIHWGWFKRNIKPQPFFVKALGLTRTEVYQNYYKQLDKLIASKSTKGIPTE